MVRVVYRARCSCGWFGAALTLNRLGVCIDDHQVYKKHVWLTVLDTDWSAQLAEILAD